MVTVINSARTIALFADNTVREFTWNTNDRIRRPKIIASNVKYLEHDFHSRSYVVVTSDDRVFYRTVRNKIREITSSIAKALVANGSTTDSIIRVKIINGFSFLLYYTSSVLRIDIVFDKNRPREQISTLSELEIPAEQCKRSPLFPKNVSEPQYLSDLQLINGSIDNVIKCLNFSVVKTDNGNIYAVDAKNPNSQLTKITANGQPIYALWFGIVNSKTILILSGEGILYTVEVTNCDLEGNVIETNVKSVIVSDGPDCTLYQRCMVYIEKIDGSFDLCFKNTHYPESTKIDAQALNGEHVVAIKSTTLDYLHNTSGFLVVSNTGSVFRLAHEWNSGYYLHRDPYFDQNPILVPRQDFFAKSSRTNLNNC